MRLIKQEDFIFMKDILNKATQWLTPSFDAETQKEINELIAENSNDLVDRFYKDMEFGTGGMRGLMGAGTNRINKYTLGNFLVIGILLF